MPKICASSIIWIDVLLKVTSRSQLDPPCLERWLSAADLTTIYSLTAKVPVEGCGRFAQNSRGSWRLCLIISHYLPCRSIFAFSVEKIGSQWHLHFMPSQERPLNISLGLGKQRYMKFNFSTISNLRGRVLKSRLRCHLFISTMYNHMTNQVFA